MKKWIEELRAKLLKGGNADSKDALDLIDEVDRLEGHRKDEDDDELA